MNAKRLLAALAALPPLSGLAMAGQPMLLTGAERDQQPSPDCPRVGQEGAVRAVVGTTFSIRAVPLDVRSAVS